jgi:hypothetical protein
MFFGKNSTYNVANLCGPTFVIEKIESPNLHRFLDELRFQILFADDEEYRRVTLD